MRSEWRGNAEVAGWETLPRWICRFTNGPAQMLHLFWNDSVCRPELLGHHSKRMELQSLNGKSDAIESCAYVHTHGPTVHNYMQILWNEARPYWPSDAIRKWRFIWVKYSHINFDLIPQRNVDRAVPYTGLSFRGESEPWVWMLSVMASMEL